MTMVLGHTVVLRGLHDPIRSLDVLKELTKRFTAEFAIRPLFGSTLSWWALCSIHG